MKKTALISIIFTVFWAALAFAQTCPQVLPGMGYEPLESIAGGGTFEPMRVAVDNRGNVYVADRFNRNFKVFDYRGNLLRSIDMNSPSGVAVDGAGKIYVGRSEDKRGFYTGEVVVYDSNFTVLYSLGKGWGEFQMPAAIATDASRVYVADSRANVVKVYDAASGLFLFQFGGYGYDDANNDGISEGSGYLVSPTGIYVHPVTGELYITDRALFKSSGTAALDGRPISVSAEWGPGAAVHIFTRDGAFIKKFGSYNLAVQGEQAGSMIMPAGIIIDSANRVIVSDYSNGYLHVFRDDGTPICTLDSLSFPQGLEFGADGRLFIATATSVAVRGIDGYVTMSVEPRSLSFYGSKCVSSTSREFVIANGGPGTLNWTIATDKSWIVPAYTGGSTPGKSSVSIPVRVDISNLAVGIHRGGLTVSAQGVEEKVAVTVEVLPLPELKASPAALSLSAFGSEKPTGTLSVELSAGGSGWSASSDSAWLGVSPSSGPSGAISVVSVSANTAILGSGNYSGSITISANCAIGSPIAVPVTLAYKRGGTINVTTNTPDATFTITGPGVYSGGGSSYTVTGVSEGTYTVVFGAVKGMREPASQSLAVADGGTADFTGLYKDMRTKKNIIATMGAGQWYAGDELRIFGADGSPLDFMVLSSPTLAERDRSMVGTALRAGVVTAAGDVDGDGREDLIVGNDKGIISGFTAEGTPIKGLYFSAFSYRAGVDIACADMDGDGAAEIIVGAGAAVGNPATVRVFKFKDGAVQDTGINILAFEGLYGVHVAAGDVDGDGAPEILAAPGGGSNSMKVRVFRTDLSGGFGRWGLKETAVVDAGLSLAGADVSSGDADGDGKDEIFAATLPLAGTAKVAGLTADGTVVVDISLASKGGVNIAAGDTDSDGLAEIAVGEGATPTSISEVRVYRPDGSFRPFKAFDGVDIYGVRVSLGRIAE